MSTFINTQIHDNSILLSYLEDRNLTLDERLRLEDELRDRMEVSLRKLDKKKLLKLRMNQSDQLLRLFTMLVRVKYNGIEKPYDSWHEFVEKTLKSDYGRFERFQIDLFNVPFDGKVVNELEPIFKLTSNPYYIKYGNKGECGDQVTAILDYLEAYNCAIPNHKEISNLLEKIHHVKIKELCSEDQERIKLKEKEIKNNEKLIAGLKLQIKEELDAIDEMKIETMKTNKVQYMIEVLYKLFGGVSVNENLNTNRHVMAYLKEALPKIDFAKVTIKTYNVLQALKNSVWQNKFSMTEEYGQILIRLLNFIELVDQGIKNQAKVNGIKREIRNIKEAAIRSNDRQL